MLTVRTGIRIWTALSLVTLATGCTTIRTPGKGVSFRRTNRRKRPSPRPSMKRKNLSSAQRP